MQSPEKRQKGTVDISKYDNVNAEELKKNDEQKLTMINDEITKITGAAWYRMVKSGHSVNGKSMFVTADSNKVITVGYKEFAKYYDSNSCIINPGSLYFPGR